MKSKKLARRAAQTEGPLARRPFMREDATGHGLNMAFSDCEGEGAGWTELRVADGPWVRSAVAQIMAPQIRQRTRAHELHTAN